MEVFELKTEEHPWYVGTQFHPENLSRVLEPSPPFLGFVAASAGVLNEVLKKRGGRGERVLGLGWGMEWRRLFCKDNGRKIFAIGE
jgi:hypothetical protein